MLLLGPPGVGKTYFSHRVAQLLGAPHAAIALDQPTAGSQLRGSDKYWGNSSSGLLFNLICLGECANPVIVLDELDKSGVSGNRGELDLSTNCMERWSRRHRGAHSTSRPTSSSTHLRHSPCTLR
jgi:ATP-dependent Lon protease